MIPSVTDYEKLGAFYLGREYDLETKSADGGLVLYDSKDLVTHGVAIGVIDGFEVINVDHGHGQHAALLRTALRRAQRKRLAAAGGRGLHGDGARERARACRPGEAEAEAETHATVDFTG